MVVVYVDDFHMVGPKSNITIGCKMLRQGLSIEPEQRIDAKRQVYSGCQLLVTSIKLPTGGMATAMPYNMENFLETCISRYLELVGLGTTLRNCSTPVLAEYHRDSPAGALGHGTLREFSWCCRTGLLVCPYP